MGGVELPLVIPVWFPRTVTASVTEQPGGTEGPGSKHEPDQSSRDGWIDVKDPETMSYQLLYVTIF